MPLHRTERSDGHKRPRWKDGSHLRVKNSAATRTPSTVDDSFVSSRAEPPTPDVPLPRHARGRPILTRGCQANAGADARIEESEAHGEVRLAILPYGRRVKLVFRDVREVAFCQLRRVGGRLIHPRAYPRSGPGSRGRSRIVPKLHRPLRGSAVEPEKPAESLAASEPVAH